ncbi:aspartyl-phosphate phosphatase Spo0E family protein [Brevibacillus ginsengisoli]|uniref:aspartyl-phosphate phosphatase Spo0E family protein n=1 Tax=Brevibacillus ginsengisoli TaxID=363854 RepID=UPI003CEDC076
MIQVNLEENLLTDLGLMEQIEAMRRQLIFLVKEKGSFTHPSVVNLSQKLDLYILQIQVR